MTELVKGSEEGSIPIITSIEVKKLFGHYNYDLILSSQSKKGIAPITMLYGDNGTGKTTILELLFHLLSTEKERGHLTFIASTPFRRITVLFSDQHRIIVERPAPALKGSFSISIENPSGVALVCEVAANEENKVKPDIPSPVVAVRDEISRLVGTVYYLADNRTLKSDEPRAEREELLYAERFRAETSREVEQDRRDVVLRVTLGRTHTWLRRRLIQASTLGEASALDIYGKIVERINLKGLSKLKSYNRAREKVIKSIEELEARTLEFSQFDLISPFDPGRLKNTLAKANENVLPAILQVISSMIDSQKVRLDAIQGLNDLLKRFVTLINGFLLHKSLVIKVKDGIFVISDYESKLLPEHLSSGEKQLILLLCNVLMAETNSLFLIDEPELSLNIKWQRKLVDVLADITRDNKCQFVLATHSIELIVKHDDHVTKLDPK